MNRLRIVGNELLKRQRNFFSLAQIVKATGLDRDKVRDILLDLWREKFLVRIRENRDYSLNKRPPFLKVRYRVIMPAKLAARIAPQYRGENNAADRLWFIMRKKITFTRRDLRVLTGASNAYVRWYTKMLAKAGIVASRGRSGEWTLLKDVGPRRPYIGDVMRGKK
ncbi:MAG TPA: hypothetical protein VK568_00260 [Thermodesulfobacteriota bacterium]|jgi:hypothetical protein|nr:hypothetical protein [Thermodesulfobacteriota bacterium]